MIAPGEMQRHYLVEKNLSHKSVCCCLSGKPWDLQYVVLMNCKFCSWYGLGLHADFESDVYMDHINRKMAIDMLVSVTSLS